uniref:Ig-like domain-containing protein n=1 Tax=Laticauda laticaudata TaxID=8630 RepID=A0A8C5RZA3_LATLA
VNPTSNWPHQPHLFSALNLIDGRRPSMSQESVKITAGKTLILTCILTQKDQPASVKWYKDLGNDQKIIYRESDKFSRGVRLVPGSQTDFSVSLNNISPEDSGPYCYSLVKEGPQSPGLSAHPSQPLLRGPLDSITVGSQISFSCSLKDSNEIQAAWTDILNYTVEAGIRYCVKSTVDILLRQEDMGSVLSCQVQHSSLENSLQQDLLLSEVVRVPPTVHLETDPLSPVQLNTSVTVTCNAEYFYPNVAKVDLFCKNPSGKGKSAGATLNSNGTYSRQSSLKITATENWNSSLFTCLVKHNSTLGDFGLITRRLKVLSLSLSAIYLTGWLLWGK